MKQQTIAAEMRRKAEAAMRDARIAAYNRAMPDLLLAMNRLDKAMTEAMPHPAGKELQSVYFQLEKIREKMK